MSNFLLSLHTADPNQVLTVPTSQFAFEPPSEHNIEMSYEISIDSDHHQNHHHKHHHHEGKDHKRHKKSKKSEFSDQNLLIYRYDCLL